MDSAVLDPGAWLSLTEANIMASLAQGCRMRFLVPHVQSSDIASAQATEICQHCEHCGVNSTEEIDWLLEYATVATEDEAAAAALAQCRGLPLISDEQKLRRSFCSHTDGAGTLFSIAQLLKRWEKDTPTDRTLIIDAVRKLQDTAYYSPPPNTPGFDWWKQFCIPSGSTNPPRQGMR